MPPKTEASGEIENDLRVGARLASRLDHRAPELNVGLRLGADLEADLETLPFERRGDGQHDIGQLRGRVHEQVGMHHEVEARQSIAPAQRVGVRTPIIDAVHAILYRGMPAARALHELLNRDPRPEND